MMMEQKLHLEIALPITVGVTSGLERMFRAAGNFYPNSTRQRFCNTDCTKAHQQAEAMFSRLVKQVFRKRGRNGSPQSGKSNAVGTENEPHP